MSIAVWFRESDEFPNGVVTYDDHVAEVERLTIEWENAQQVIRNLLETQRADAAEVERLREALRNLVQMNEEHNAAVEAVIGRPLNWSDNYLDEARAALAGEGDEP